MQILKKQYPNFDSGKNAIEFVKKDKKKGLIYKRQWYVFYDCVKNAIVSVKKYIYKEKVLL